MKTILCGNREVHLRFPARTILSIRDTAAKVVGLDRLKKIGYSPIDGKVPVEVVSSMIEELDIMLWLFGKGLDWKESGAKPEEAADLYDDYMDVPEEELDTGEHYEAFLTAIGEALIASRGMDLKKLQAKQKAEQERLKANAEKTIEDIKASTSTEPGTSAVES